MTDGVPQTEEPASLPEPIGNGMADSSSNRPFFQPTDWLSFGMTTSVALLVYLCTLTPGVTLENSGTFSTSAAYGGVAQPPGFPVWTVYSWLFTRLLPFSTIAWRVAVGSAAAAALACGLVALMVSAGGRVLLQNTPAFANRKPAEQNQLQVICGYVAGMALGLSSAVWRQAVRADYWALSDLLFAGLIAWFTAWMFTPHRRGFLYGTFLLFGLLLTSNQELIVLTPALLLSVLWGDKKLGRDIFLGLAVVIGIGWWATRYNLISLYGSYFCANATLELAFLPVAVAAVHVVITTRRIGSEWKSASICAACLLLGLGWYFYLPVASMTTPPVNWAYPRTVDGFVHTITRGQYEKAFPTHELDRFSRQLWEMLKQTGREFGWLYFWFIVLPVYLLPRTGRSARNWALGLLAMLACAGPLVVALLNPSPDRQTMDLTLPYFSALYVVLAVWTGLGLMVAGSLVAKTPRRPPPGFAPNS